MRGGLLAGQKTSLRQQKGACANGCDPFAARCCFGNPVNNLGFAKLRSDYTSWHDQHILAHAGLLDNRHAVTHWLDATQLQQCYPDVRVQDDAIYVKDGSIYTSAGITAGIDLSLSLVGEDLGRQVSQRVAKRLVVFLKRPGGQRQFSSELLARMRPDAACALLERANVSVKQVARQSGFGSEYNLRRAFTANLGVVPTEYRSRFG